MSNISKTPIKGVYFKNDFIPSQERIKMTKKKFFKLLKKGKVVKVSKKTKLEKIAFLLGVKVKD